MSTVIKKIKIQKWLKSTDFKKHSKKHKPYKMYIPFLFKTLQSFLVVTDGSRPRGILSPYPSPCWAPSHILCWCLCPLPGMPIPAELHVSITRSQLTIPSPRRPSLPDTVHPLRAAAQCIPTVYGLFPCVLSASPPGR